MLKAADRKALNDRVAAAYNRITQREDVKILALRRAMRIGQEAAEKNPEITEDELEALMRESLRVTGSI